LLGACVALPLAGLAIPALAANPDCWAGIVQAPEATYTPVPITEANMPALRLIADADAMFRRMAAEMHEIEAQMDALATMPFTQHQVIPATLGGSGWTSAEPGNAVVFTAVSNGRESCSQTVTYSYPPNGGAPIVRVSQTGNACGALRMKAPVPAAQPFAPRAAPHPVQVPHRLPVWTVEYHAPGAARG
jgi:hypothetical protein